MQKFDPFNCRDRTDPYDVYRRYRCVSPIHWGLSPDRFLPGGHWYVFQFETAETVLTDSRFGHRPYHHDAANIDSGRPFRQMVESWMLFEDPPRHTHLRRAVGDALRNGPLERLEERVRIVIQQLIERIEPLSHCDFMAQFARILPVRIIAEILGIPPEEHQRWHRLSADIFRALAFGGSISAFDRADRAVNDLSRVLRDVIATRRQRPHNDLVSCLLRTAQSETALSEHEVIATCILVLGAGHVTTTHLIGNGILALLRHRDQLDTLRAAPHLIDAAVDELLRYDSPVQMVNRIALDDVMLGDSLIRRGQGVAVIVGSANRDPRVYDLPDQLNITRSNRRHLAFGTGIHRCLGESLARLEARIALSAVLQQLPGLRLAAEGPTWGDDIAMRGLETLPVKLANDSDSRLR